MTFAHRRVRTALHAFVLLAVFLTLNTAAVTAVGSGGTQGTAKPAPSPRRVAASGDRSILQSIYLPDLMPLPVVQQPAGDEDYVSGANDQATQFALAARFGNIGLLAHNTLSGRFFSQLTVGEVVRVVYRDGRVEAFVITEILRYQALEPDSSSSSFRDLATDEIQSAGQVFARVYTGRHHVTFQTCIANFGEISWGRLFVIAMPVAS